MPMRVFFLVIAILLVLALGGLEVLAARSLQVAACPMPDGPAPVAAHWTSEYWK